MNEAQTKHNFITPALKKAGWDIVKNSRIRLEFPISQGRLIGQGRRQPPLKADYVLEYKNRRLAVIEAKASDKYYTEGLSQAKNYAQKLNIRFAYATNGKQIYQVDIQTDKQEEIKNFPTPAELWHMTFAQQENNTQESQAVEKWKEKFLKIPFETRGGTWQLRYYQEIAIEKVLDAISENKKRILLTLATGTGKTAIAFQLAWKLFKTRWNLQKNGQRLPRILFLADRNILANQAFNAFSAFEEEALVRISPDEIRKRKKVPTTGNIFFTIFQTFMSGKNNTAYFGKYPKDFFDLVIIDECHRGGSNDESSWRDILKYFSSAVQLGLTATPKRKNNVNTYDYFGNPVYSYALKEGIHDGFLTPFRVQIIQSTIDEYEHTDDNIVKSGEVKQGDYFTEPNFNTNIQIREREKFRVKQFLNLMKSNEKTIVFCKNQEHALLVRDLINENAINKNHNYCQRVTADEGLGDQYLRDFQDNEKTIPTILTTSHKLSTGVDAPEIRNIVLMRPINSMIEFKQIIGRGTRLFDDKAYFTIYDFVKAHENFNDPEWDGNPLEVINSIDTENALTDKQPCCSECQIDPCICDTKVCSICDNVSCVCEKPQIEMAKIELSKENYRNINRMIEIKFLNGQGELISAKEFIQNLFQDLPEFFTSEQELREIWSNPQSRAKLLQQLADKGYSTDNLKGLRKLVNAENSDMFDVLIYIAYNKDFISREQRVTKAKNHLKNYNNTNQQFLEFVFKQYSKEGEIMLDPNKIRSLLELKYKTIQDAKNQLGDITNIKKAFINSQKYLYEVA